MTFTPTTSGIVEPTNSETTLNQRSWNLDASMVISATCNTDTGTIELASSASDISGEYDGKVIEITGGVGINTSYVISSYDGDTKICTINDFIEILPDPSNSTYIVHERSGQCRTQSQSQQYKTLRLSATDSAYDGFYNQCFIKIFTHDGDYNTKRILSYDGTTKVVTLDSDITEHTNSESYYVISGESGSSAGSNTSTTLEFETSHGHSEVTDYYNGLFVEIYSGTGSGQVRKITDYVGTTATVATWDVTPDATSLYNIFSGWGASNYIDSSTYSQVTSALVSGSAERTVIYQQLGLLSDGSKNRGKYAENNSATPSSVHTLVIVTNYYKVKLVTMGTSLTGSIQTIFHTAKNKALTSFVDEPINKNNDCELTRSVIAGKSHTGEYKNIQVTPQGYLDVHVSGPTTAFSELQVSHLSPVAQINFPYHKNESMIAEFVDSGTTVTMIAQGDGSTAQKQFLYTPQASLLTSGDYFDIFGSTDYYVWYNVDEGGGDPTPAGGATAIEVDVSATDLATAVANATITAINSVAGSVFTVVSLIGNLIQITNDAVGTHSSIQTQTMPTTTVSAITYNKNESTLSLTNGAGIGTYAVMTSKRIHKYRPGQGGIARFTAVFDEPTFGIQQIAGIGNQVSGFFFGVNPANGRFGILHRKSGLASIQKLTITNAVGSDTVTLIVDGITIVIAVTESTAQGVAREIAAAQDQFKPTQWLCNAIDDTVVFLSETASGSRAVNDYSFSATGATAGTWTSVEDGEAVDNEWIDQPDWNHNKMNGYIGDHFNPTKGNVFQIQYQWLGYGAVHFSLESSHDGQFIRVHSIEYANHHVKPSVSQPVMKLLWAINTTTTTIPGTLKMASGAMFNEGEIKEFDNAFSHTRVRTNVGNTDEQYLVSYRNTHTFYGKGNNTVIIPKYLNITNDATKGAIVRIYSGSVLTDPIYTYINEAGSTVVSDIVATAFTTTTLRYSIGLAKDSSEQIDLSTVDNLFLFPQDAMTFTIQGLDGAKPPEITSVLVWHEEQ